MALLTAVALLFSIALPAAWAENGNAWPDAAELLNLFGSLFERDEEEDDRYKVEKTIVQIIGTLAQQYDGEANEIDRKIGGWIGEITNGEGEFDLSGIDSLIGSFFGFDDGSEDEVLYSEIEQIGAAIDAYILREYRTPAEDGDAQIVSRFLVTNENADTEEGVYRTMGYFSLMNCTADGKDLRMKDYVGRVELLTLTRNGDGTYGVTEAAAAEDGEGYADSVAALCAEYGITTEWFYSSMEYSEWSETLRLVYWLDDHPEYERIEFRGELKTGEELNDIADIMLLEIIEGVSAAPEE